jgi:hypothetical protein
MQQSEEIYDESVKEMLERLAKNDLVISPKKCVWGGNEVEFLGYILTPQGMRMAEDQTNGIQEWQTPKSLRDVQLFLGFANFYRRIILGFSNIYHPLTESTKGDKKDWEWPPDIENAFVDLKERFTIAPILTHYSPEHQCIIETDASDFALGAVISQKSSDDKLHPIAYHSRKFSPTKINYEIYAKELFAVMYSFKIWRKYLEGALLSVQVYTDQQNLEYFTTTKVRNRRHAHWARNWPA